MSDRLKLGDIATCRAGYLGLITEIFREADGFKYTGVHLGKVKLGRPWESIGPKRVANINELLEADK